MVAVDIPCPAALAVIRTIANEARHVISTVLIPLTAHIDATIHAQLQAFLLNLTGIIVTVTALRMQGTETLTQSSTHHGIIFLHHSISAHGITKDTVFIPRTAAAGGNILRTVNSREPHI